MKNISCLVLFFFLCWWSGSVQAYQILFYYNSQDGTNGGLRKCAAVLQAAGNQVTLVDVAGKRYDPTSDNWGAPYDQVWDARFVKIDKEDCGSGSPAAADYFDDHWRSKAVSFLNHSGNLYIEAEYFLSADRDEGLYRFLKETGAVKPGYDPCPPSPRGNSSTEGEGFYPVKGLGPVSFYGNMVGGIPLRYLTGESFVGTAEGWADDDGVDRSIVCGWTGDRLGGDVKAPSCAKGKLFMVWDATMWTLWQPAPRPQVQRQAPIWDEYSWFSYGSNKTEEDGSTADYPEAREVTRKFFPAIARWLGSRVEPCEVAAPPPTPPGVSMRVGGRVTPTLTAVRLPDLSARSAQVPVSSSLGPNPASAGPQTIVFDELPVNIYVHFADGPGEYRLDIFDAQGRKLRALFDQQVTFNRETWISWDGLDEQGKLRTVGTYYAALYKEGRFLKKIVLVWVLPQRNGDSER